MTNPRPVEADDLPLQIPTAVIPGPVLYTQPVDKTFESGYLPQQGQGPAPAGIPGYAGGEVITCPECGEVSTIDAAHRRAQDFCPSCDYPLFWARSAVVVPSGEATGASLRRLPGTVGRAATAALDCPHCGEPNSPIAMVCIRCGGDMHPVAPPPPMPEPEMVYIPPPPMPEPEPVEDRIWMIVGLAVILVIIIVLVVWSLQN